MYEESWQLGCEQLTDAFTNEPYSLIHSAISQCYANDFYFLNAEYSPATSEQQVTVLSAENKCPKTADYYKATEEKLEQFLHYIKYNCSLEDLLNKYHNLNIEFNKAAKDSLIGTSSTYQNFEALKLLANHFKIALWHRELVQTQKFHSINYSQVFSDYKLNSVMNAVYLPSSAEQKYYGGCAAIFENAHTDLQKKTLDKLLSDCNKKYEAEPSVRDVIDYTAQYLKVTKGRIKIYITKEVISDSFYSPPHWRYPTRRETVFVSVIEEHIIDRLLHELGHMVLDKMFRNQQKPFSHYDELTNSAHHKAYIEARNKFIKEIFTVFGSKNLMEDQQKYDAIKNLDKLLCAKAYFHFNLNETMQASRYLGHCSHLLSSQKPSLADLEVWMNRIWKNDSMEVAYFAHRIYDWSIRGRDRSDLELINRVPELRSLNLQSQPLIAALKPLEFFWDTKISPLARNKNTFPNSYFNPSPNIPYYKYALLTGVGALLGITVLSTYQYVKFKYLGTQKRSRDYPAIGDI